MSPLRKLTLRAVVRCPAVCAECTQSTQVYWRVYNRTTCSEELLCTKCATAFLELDSLPYDPGGS